MPKKYTHDFVSNLIKKEIKKEKENRPLSKVFFEF